MRSSEAGRPKELTDDTAGRWAKLAMQMKQEGELELCYDNLKAVKPELFLNPSTGQPICRKTVNKVLTTQCYNKTPGDPLKFLFAPKRRPLSEEQMAARCSWAKRLLREGRDSAWFHKRVIWADVCNKVLPGQPRKAAESVRFGKSEKRRLMKPGSRNSSANLGGTKGSQKQCSFGDKRVYYIGATKVYPISIHKPKRRWKHDAAERLHVRNPALSSEFKTQN